MCGLGPDLIDIHSISLAARYRTLVRTRSAKALRRFRQPERVILLLFFRSAPTWTRNFFAPSMARSTADAFNIVCRLDSHDKLHEVPQNKKQKVATSLLCDKLHKQVFAGPISLLASKVAGQNVVMDWRAFCPT